MAFLRNKLKNSNLIVSAALFLLLMSSALYGKYPEWYEKFRKVKPLISTRQEVEKIFDNPKIKRSFEGEWNKEIQYEIKDLKEGILFVSYSQGKCSEMKSDGFDVSEDVVLELEIYPEEEFQISNFELDLSKFEKTEIAELSETYTYRNEHSGEEFTENKTNLNHFKIFPSKSQKYLECIRPKDYGKPPEWYKKLRQVKPMFTTRQEAELIFNNPEIRYIYDGEWSKKVEYKITDGKEGVLSVSYSQGKCSEMKSDGYNVEKDVILNITIYMEEDFDISAFGFDLNKFEKTKIGDIKDVYTYYNPNSGEYFTGTSEKLHNFQLLPSKILEEQLECENSAGHFLKN